jgi:hypothetical protein
MSLATDLLGLLFVEPHGTEHLAAEAHVYLKVRLLTLDGKVLLTSPTAGWSEFEQELDRLKSELDAIREEAALRFAHCSAQRYGDIRKADPFETDSPRGITNEKA